MKKMYRGFEFEETHNGEVFLLMPDGTKKWYLDKSSLFYAIEQHFEDYQKEHIAQMLRTKKTEALAEATGIDKPSISRWKGGKDMSAPVLAMWRFYFELEEMKAQQKTLIEALEIKTKHNGYLEKLIAPYYKS